MLQNPAQNVKFLDEMGDFCTFWAQKSGQNGHKIPPLQKRKTNKCQVKSKHNTLRLQL